MRSEHVKSRVMQEVRDRLQVNDQIDTTPNISYGRNELEQLAHEF